MKTYALIERNIIQQLFEAEGDIYDYFHPDTVWVDVTNTPDVQPGWSATMADDEWVLTPYQPSDEDVLAVATSDLSANVALADREKLKIESRIATLKDAVLLKMATDDEVVELEALEPRLIEWKRYSVFLGRVTAQAGWPQAVDWPERPGQVDAVNQQQA